MEQYLTFKVAGHKNQSWPETTTEKVEDIKIKWNEKIEHDFVGYLAQKLRKTSK